MIINNHFCTHLSFKKLKGHVISMNEELLIEYFNKLEEIYNLDQEIVNYKNKMDKELEEERNSIKTIIINCHSKEEIVNTLRGRTMKADIRNSIYIGLHMRQLSTMKELRNLIDELGMSSACIPEVDNMIDTVNEMIDTFENKIKIMTEGLQKNSLAFNEFLTNSLNG